MEKEKMSELEVKQLAENNKLAFFISLWSNVNMPYLYAFTFLICVVVILYRNNRICILGNAVAIIGNAVLNFLYFTRADDPEPMKIIINDIFVVASATLSATSEQVAASSENSLTVSKSCVDIMENTKSTLDEIFNLSEGL